MTIRALIWNENEHEKTNALVAKLYPQGIHGAISKAFDGAKDISFEIATQDMPEHGLTEERLKNTDVLLWWGTRSMGLSAMPLLNGCKSGSGRAWGSSSCIPAIFQKSSAS